MSDQAPWREKANRVIRKMCRESWRRANTKADGTTYKRHRPYAVPHDAEMLVNALAKDDEVLAKAIFVRQAVIGEIRD